MTGQFFSPWLLATSYFIPGRARLKKSYNFFSIPKIQNFTNLIKTNSSLYLLHFFPDQPLLSFIAFITFPVALAKTAQALLQVLVLYWLIDIHGNIVISLSYSLSCCQGYIAAIQLVEIDTKERKDKGVQNWS